MSSSPDLRQPISVLLFAASLRRESLNVRLAAVAQDVLEQLGATVDVAEMHEFSAPAYGGDDEDADGIPAGPTELRRRLEANDAFVIVSPEYNASMPGGLKNVIDWTSRFRPQPFNGKHCQLLSASPSMVGGNRGLWSLRMPLEHLGTRVYPDMFSLSMAHKAFSDDDLADQKLRERFDKTIEAFLSLAEAAKHYPCIKRAWVEFLGEPPGVGADRVDPVVPATP